MAQGSSKATKFIGLIRFYIPKLSFADIHSTEFFPLPKALNPRIPRILQSNSKAFSSSSSIREALLEGELGAFNLPGQVNSYRPRSKLASHGLGAFCQAELSSCKDGRKFLCRRELLSGRQTVHEVGLQRLGNNSRTRSLVSSFHSSVKHEFNSLQGRGDIRGCRTYYVDGRGVQHFRRRGPAAWWEQVPSQRFMGVLLICAGGGTVLYFSNRQTVPYTHRKHFMLVSPSLERSIGDHSFQMIMNDYKGRVLPANHPESVRVHRIANEVIEALMSEVKVSDWGQVEKGGESVLDVTKDWDKDNERKSEQSLLEPYGGHIHKQDDLLDDTWVHKSRNKGLQTGQGGYTKHLEGMKWKVVVVDTDLVNAVCIPGGKIVVFTGLIKKFRNDAEVATVLAHEIGHAVARHSAEALTHNLFIVIAQLIVLTVIYVPGLVNSISELLLKLPFSRRMEIEADHIGLLLMAAAGYDPRRAPGFYEKLGELEKAPEYAQYVSTHPSGKKRGELLSQTATMAEAMRVYQQRMSGQGTEGFF